MPKGIMQCSVKLGASLGALTASLFAVQVHAQDAAPQAELVDNVGLEDIVVTARKQSESMMKVPVTASAISAADLTRHQINDVTQVVSQISSIRFDQTYGGGGGTLTIRGIGSSTSDDGVDQTVATVFDGLQTSRGTFTKLGFLDLEQVEVLKGPQALFFGKNSPGGVLSLKAAGPTDELAGYIRAGYATGVGEKKVEAAVSGPLGGGFRARLAGSYTDSDGWIRNTAAANVPYSGFGVSQPFGPTQGALYDKNYVREAAGRLTIDYKPTSDFSATLRLAGIRNRNAGVSSFGEITSCGVGSKPTFITVVDPVNDCKLDFRSAVAPIRTEVRGTDSTFPADGVHPGELDAFMGGLTLEYQAGPVSITSVTGYMYYRLLENHASSNSFGYGSNGVFDKWHQFSQEFRVVTGYDGPINFAGGLYYDETDTKQHGPNIIFGLPGDTRTKSAANPFFGSFFTYVFDGHTTSKSYSAFGQVRWKMLDTLEFDAGVRYSHDIRTGDVVNSFINNNFSPSNNCAAPLTFLQPEGCHVAGKRVYDNFSPELTLTWTATPDTILFGSYRTGYKPGQSANPYIVSAGLSAAPNATAPLFYQTETVKGFEVGFKTQLLDRKLRLTGAAFTYKYNDLQVSNFNSAAFVLTPLAGDMKTEGFELNATFRPVPALTLSGSVGYTKARWTNFPGVACYSGAPFGAAAAPSGAPVCLNDPVLGPVEDLTGFQKFRSPDWSGNVGFIYELPVGDTIKAEINANLSFVSHYNSQENNSPYAEQKGYALLDAGIKVSTADDRISFSVIGKNLTDKKYVGGTYDQATNDASTTVFGLPGRPRTVLFQVGFMY